jgi:DNA-binding response OmpR family regulator
MVLSKTILVDDDDAAVRNLLALQLRTQYTVHQASEAHAALALLGKIKVPDLILCDVMMPGMSGLELAKHLRAQHTYKHVPIIFLTARADALDVIKGINAGAKHYITKPFSMNDLLEKVAKAVR